MLKHYVGLTYQIPMLNNCSDPVGKPHAIPMGKKTRNPMYPMFSLYYSNIGFAYLKENHILFLYRYPLQPTFSLHYSNASLARKPHEFPTVSQYM